jgi:hypothetical protein
VTNGRWGLATDLCGLFLSVTLPNLESLAIDNCEVDEYTGLDSLDWPQEHFLTMLSNSQPFSLTTFSIKNVLINHTQLIECLKLLPTLETLIFMDFMTRPEIPVKPFYNAPVEETLPNVFPGLVRALTWRVGRDTVTPPLVPKLRTLTLAGRIKVEDARGYD